MRYTKRELLLGNVKRRKSIYYQYDEFLPFATSSNAELLPNRRNV